MVRGQHLMRADFRGVKTKIQSLGVKIRCLSLPFPRHPRSIAFEFGIKIGDSRRSWRLCGFVRDRFSDTIISRARSLRSLKPRRSRRKAQKRKAAPGFAPLGALCVL
jgi:hypothetical protein